MHLRSKLFSSCVVLIALCVQGTAVTHTRRGPTSQHVYSKRSSRSTAKPTSQRAIDDSRATEIQGALAGAGYLPNGPSGHWDSETEAAMQRYQSDHGWQTKLIPDSRAIIKLGLGPNNTGSSVASVGPGAQ